MKRTPLRRTTGLSRSTTPIRKRSKRVAALYREQRIPLVRRLLAERPACEIAWDANCRGRSESVHEVIKRSHGGAIVPGPKAEAQGQRFVAACLPCNGAVEDHPAEARSRGWA